MAQIVKEDTMLKRLAAMLGWLLAAIGLGLAGLPAGAAADPLPRSTADRPDDFKGAQVHLVYAVPADGVDRALDTNGTIEDSVAGFQDWLSRETGGRALRVDTAGGALDVTFLELSKTDAQMAAHDPAIVVEIERQLEAAGLGRADRIYAVYYDGTSTYACGQAAWPPSVPGRTAAVYLRGEGCAAQPSASYWQFGMLHEIVHAVGFVARCAPNHTRAGHVSDGATDLMYAGGAGDPGWSPSTLDVGRDDYYEHRDKDCPDLADSPYLSPRLPSGNLTRNPSFEHTTSGWGTRDGVFARVVAADAPHGDFALKVSASPGSRRASVSDCPVGIGCSVGNTTVGETYVASAHVRAASRQSGGLPLKPVTIVLSEYTQGGALVKERIGETVTPTASFRRLSVAADAIASGHVIGVRLQQPMPAARDAFFADMITLVKASTVMRVIGGPPIGAPIAWTPVGVNSKRVSSAPLLTSEPADLARLSVVLDGGGAPGTTGQPLRGVVFRSANGEPGALVGRTDEVVIAPGRSAGAVTLAFNPPLRVAPGTYWLGLHAGGAAATARYASTGGVGGLRHNIDSYANGTADPFGALNSGTAAVPVQAVGG